MWCSKILVAYDGSAPSEGALALARSIGEQDETVELVFVHVVKLYATGNAEILLDKVLVEKAEKTRSHLEDVAKQVPNDTQVRLLKGSSPAELILKSANEEGCDLIVMGSRGQGGVKGYLGSVSYAVVQQSPVTVLIAKDKAGR